MLCIYDSHTYTIIQGLYSVHVFEFFQTVKPLYHSKKGTQVAHLPISTTADMLLGCAGVHGGQELFVRLQELFIKMLFCQLP